MKYLVIAILTALVASLIIFFGVSAIDRDLAKSLAVIPLGGFNYIAESLKTWDSKRKLASDRPTMAVESFDSFAISWPLLLVYGSLMIFAVFEVATGLAGFVSGLFWGAIGRWVELPQLDQGGKAWDAAEFMGVIIVTVPAALTGGLLVGRWMGWRSARNGIAAFLLSTVLGFIIYVVFEYLSQMSTTGVAPVRALVLYLVPFVIFLIAGIYGYWRGRRQKLSRYMQYLLKVLPIDSQNIVVDLAFQEAKRLAKV